MGILLHLSDPHFGTEQAPVVAALSALAQRLGPALVVVSGDLTQRARRAQFAGARAFLAALPACPRLVVPGNHDIPLFNLWARLLHPYAGYRAAFGDGPPILDLPDWLVLGIDTTSPRRHVNGAISARSIEDVRERLARARPAQLKVVVVHHPVEVPDAPDEHNLLRGAEQAVPIWGAAGADLILAGHIHLPACQRLERRYGRQAAHAWSVLAGTALSWRVRPNTPNSVNVIHYEEAGGQRNCFVERWDYQADMEAFAQVSRQGLALRT